jgi:hypothetical protein
MANKKLLLGLVVLSILMCTSMVSAYTYSYGASAPSCPTCGIANMYGVRSYYQDPSIRVGGFFGQSSMNLIGLRAGTYYQNCYQGTPAMFYQPCSGVRTGGYFGNVYGFRGMPTYGGYGGYYGKYSSLNYPYMGVM